MKDNLDDCQNRAKSFSAIFCPSHVGLHLYNDGSFDNCLCLSHIDFTVYFLIWLFLIFSLYPSYCYCWRLN